MLDADALRAKLSITSEQLTELVAAGMPCVDRDGAKWFEPLAVRDWLFAHKYATTAEAPTPDDDAPPEAIATTRHEAAAHFGVSVRTIADWCLKPGFPGRAGTQGRQDGYFPLRQIGEWLRAHNLAAIKPLGETPNDAYLAVRTAREAIRRDADALRLEEMRGRLIDAEETTRLVTRVNALARQILYQLPPKLEAFLPPTTADAVRAEFRRNILHTLDITCGVLAEAIEGEKEDESEEAEGDTGS
jgi:phage terminase Nu1 subunit (DNA packaging protein)